jgi:hypothetical protein
MTRDMLERTTPPEGPVDDDGNALVRRYGWETVLRFTVEDVVCELREIEWLSAHQVCEVVMPSSVRCSDPDIAHALFRFPRLESF